MKLSRGRLIISSSALPRSVPLHSTNFGVNSLLYYGRQLSGINTGAYSLFAPTTGSHCDILPCFASAIGSRRSVSRITQIRKNFALLKALKPKWKPPYPGWRPDPETEVSLHKRIRKKAKNHRVFPDVLPEPFTPYFHLKVTYPDEVLVMKGSFLRPSQVLSQPRVEFPSQGSNKWWTLVMTSPDDPEVVELVNELPVRRGREVLHWLITNIPDNDISKGEVLCEYLPALPKRFGDPHRYAFLMFEQLEGKMDFGPNVLGLGQSLPVLGNNWISRKEFNTFSFQERFNLKPKGLAFFNAKWDSAVSNVYQKVLNVKEPMGIPPPEYYRKKNKYLDVTKW